MYSVNIFNLEGNLVLSATCTEAVLLLIIEKYYMYPKIRILALDYKGESY